MRRALAPRLESGRSLAALVLLPVRAFPLLVVLLSVSGANAEGALTLSVQGCNTRCQSEQTDCVLRCDGEIPCIQQCQKVAEGCVDTCTKR
jgi:hypothetical protein